MTTSKQYDFLNRLTSISSTAPNGSSLSSFAYVYNQANQRVRNTLHDGSFWAYEYDRLGQVVSGTRHWQDGTPVAGQQFGYSFDDIGNRTQTKAGGDENGANLRTANYYANALNQYERRDVPAAVDVMGVAMANNSTVQVTDTTPHTPYRKGEYFRKELPADNSSAPVWKEITVSATGETAIQRHQFVPQNQEVFHYDHDGNLTNDGQWTYFWDAENRLARMTANTAVGPQISLRFDYDSKGRRIQKQLWSNTNWLGNAASTNQFVYDGWNLIAEFETFTPQPVSLVRSYAWGLDLSGLEQGAGGIGGLLFICDLASAICHAPTYDGNGNIMALANMADSSVQARYEYGPFGELLRATDPMAKVNPFRFSTKYQDDETDLLYYGYRCYSSSAGRWLSRDPIEEKGGPSLYCMVFNQPALLVDPLGRCGCECIRVTVNSLQEFETVPVPTPDPYVVSNHRMVRLTTISLML